MYFVHILYIRTWLYMALRRLDVSPIWLWSTHIDLLEYTIYIEYCCCIIIWDGEGSSWRASNGLGSRVGDQVASSCSRTVKVQAFSKEAWNGAQFDVPNMGVRENTFTLFAFSYFRPQEYVSPTIDSSSSRWMVPWAKVSRRKGHLSF